MHRAQLWTLWTTTLMTLMLELVTLPQAPLWITKLWCQDKMVDMSFKTITPALNKVCPLQRLWVSIWMITLKPIWLQNSMDNKLPQLSYWWISKVQEVLKTTTWLTCMLHTKELLPHHQCQLFHLTPPTWLIAMDQLPTLLSTWTAKLLLWWTCWSDRLYSWILTLDNIYMWNYFK